MIDRLRGRMHVRIHAEGVPGIRITIKVKKSLLEISTLIR